MQDKSFLCKLCNCVISNKGATQHFKFKHSVNFIKYVEENIEQFPDYHLCIVCKKVVCITETCGKKCKGIAQSERTKGIDPWAKMKSDNPMYFKNMLQENGKKAMKTNAWFLMNDDKKEITRKKLSESAKKRVGNLAAHYGKKHSPETIQKIFKYRKMTDIEKIIYDFLKKENIDFKFQYFISSTSTHSYDFKIKGIPLIIEADGDYWHGGPECKIHSWNVDTKKETDVLKDSIAESKGIKVLRFWGSDIKENTDKVFIHILEEINKLKAP